MKNSFLTQSFPLLKTKIATHNKKIQRLEIHHNLSLFMSAVACCRLLSDRSAEVTDASELDEDFHAWQIFDSSLAQEQFNVHYLHPYSKTTGLT